MGFSIFPLIDFHVETRGWSAIFFFFYVKAYLGINSMKLKQMA